MSVTSQQPAETEERGVDGTEERKDRDGPTGQGTVGTTGEAWAPEDKRRLQRSTEGAV